MPVKNREITYTHIETGSRTICFMLSGAGYTYDKPLFYYSTMAMLQNKIDVVHIHYAYGQDLFKHPLNDISEAIIADVKPIVFEVLKNNDYNNTVFLGKSLGTIPITMEFMKRKDFSASTMILLTPLLKYDVILDAIGGSNHQGLLVIGDKDPHYNANQLAQLRHSNFIIETVKGANHSLDIEELDTENSILSLSKVMGKIQEVIRMVHER
ncbi:alpha/beta hydrolase [Lentibacillus populi]